VAAAGAGGSGRRLAIYLAQHLNSRIPTGQLKHIATRDCLNRLQTQGLLGLPPHRGTRRSSISLSTIPTHLPCQQPWWDCRAEPVEALQGSELWPLGWYLAGTADPIWARIAGSLDQDP